MPQSYTSLHYHFVFSTKGRLPTITPAIRARLYDYFGGILRVEGGVLVAAGGVPDHVHLLVRLNQNRAVADVLRVLKTNSSKWTHETFPEAGVWWQSGYGAFTVDRSMLGRVTGYIANQEEHHSATTFQDEFRALLAEHGIEYDEKYLWE